jgi:hypothetical protein
MFGWFSKNPSNPTFDDFKQNGLYCRSGLAFPSGPNTALCTSTDHIKFKGKKIASPYQCDPSDNADFCQLNYNITVASIAIPAKQLSFNTSCKCALDGFYNPPLN